VVVRAVDLHELAVTIATVTRLLDAFTTLCAGLPDPGRNHPLTKRFGRDPDVVVLLKLLLGQRRDEVYVALAHKTDHVLLVRLGNAIGRRSATALIREARRAVSLKCPKQPPNLTLASVKTTRRLGLRHASLREPRDDRECVHFSRTQGEEIAGHGPD